MNSSFVVEDKSFSDIAIEQFSTPAENKMKDLVELSYVLSSDNGVLSVTIVTSNQYEVYLTLKPCTHL